jgi:hypothetical protein
VKIKHAGNGEVTLDSHKQRERDIREAIKTGDSETAAVAILSLTDIDHDEYVTVTEDDGTPLWSGWLDGRDEPAPEGARAGDGDRESNLVAHARRELELIGEEPDVIDWYCRTVREFASYGHSGGSASVTIPVLNKLLQYEPLTPLTADPAEWTDRSEMSGYPLWQNARDSRAMSEDGGATYWLVSGSPGADGKPVMYQTGADPAPGGAGRSAEGQAAGA